MAQNKRKRLTSQTAVEPHRVFFKTQYSYMDPDYFSNPVQLELCFEPRNESKSMTVPEQSYTIRELLERFTTGGVPPIYQEGSYSSIESDEELLDSIGILDRPDFDRLDVQDVIDSFNRYRSSLQDVKSTDVTPVSPNEAITHTPQSAPTGDSGNGAT